PPKSLAVVRLSPPHPHDLPGPVRSGSITQTDHQVSPSPIAEAGPSTPPTIAFASDPGLAPKLRLPAPGNELRRVEVGNRRSIRRSVQRWPVPRSPARRCTRHTDLRTTSTHAGQYDSSHRPARPA